MPEPAVVQIINQGEIAQYAVKMFVDMLRSGIWELGVALLAVAVIAIIGKNTAKSIVAWGMFKWDDHLGVDRKVRLFDGRIGTIKTFSVFGGVTIELKDTFKVIPWEEWKGSYETFKPNGGKRRADDVDS